MRRIAACHRSRARVIDRLFIARRCSFYIQFRRILFLTIRFIVNSVFSATLAISAIAYIHFFSSNAVVVRYVFNERIRPIDGISFRSVVSRYSPAFIEIITLIRSMVEIASANDEAYPICIYVTVYQVLFRIIRTGVIEGARRLDSYSMDARMEAVFYFNA